MVDSPTEGFIMNRRSTYYEDLEMEGPIEERFLPTRPSMYLSSRDRHQETPQVCLKNIIYNIYIYIIIIYIYIRAGMINRIINRY